jgi:hypothetical protein
MSLNCKEYFTANQLMTIIIIDKIYKSFVLRDVFYYTPHKNILFSF